MKNKDISPPNKNNPWDALWGSHGASHGFAHIQIVISGGTPLPGNNDGDIGDKTNRAFGNVLLVYGKKDGSCACMAC